jgi:arylsulfatase A-like enzyme
LAGSSPDPFAPRSRERAPFLNRAGTGRLVAAGLLVAAVAAAVVIATDAEEPAPPDRPNLLLITTDDQSLPSFRRRFMPRTFDELVDRGTTFTRAVAAPPLCCPSRAGVLAAQYPHNHGVFDNVKAYTTLRERDNVLPEWLRRAGYATGLVGKPLNKYEEIGGAQPGPGFDYWSAIYDKPLYYGGQISLNGEVQQLGTERQDYMTTLNTRHAIEFMGGALADEKPFFLWYAPYTPHAIHGPSPAGPRQCDDDIPVPADEAAYSRVADEPLPQSPNFNEADRSDKPPYMSEGAPMTAEELEKLTGVWRCTLASLEEVDRGVSEMLAELRRRDALDDTIVIFQSDNGTFFGEHAEGGGKAKVYSAASIVPFVALVPERFAGSKPPPRRVGEVIATIDIAPTLLDYAEAAPCASIDACREPDGRSLRPLLEGGEWPADRGVLMELQHGCSDWEAVRTERWLYAEESRSAPAECGLGTELYDLRRDPYELEDLGQYGGSQRVRDARKELAARLDRLRSCAGLDGADACE